MIFWDKFFKWSQGVSTPIEVIHSCKIFKAVNTLLSHPLSAKPDSRIMLCATHWEVVGKGGDVDRRSLRCLRVATGKKSSICFERSEYGYVFGS